MTDWIGTAWLDTRPLLPARLASIKGGFTPLRLTVQNWTTIAPAARVGLIRARGAEPVQ